MTKLANGLVTIELEDLDEAHGGLGIGALSALLPQQQQQQQQFATGQPIYTGFPSTGYGQPSLPGYGYGLSPTYIQPAYVQPALGQPAYVQPGYGPLAYGQPYGQPFYGGSPVIVEEYYDYGPPQDKTASAINAVAGILGAFF